MRTYTLFNVVRESPSGSGREGHLSRHLKEVQEQARQLPELQVEETAQARALR